MKGSVLGFNEADGTGVISGEDGNRYSFSMEEVKDDTEISTGSKVDFDVDDGFAKEIYGVVGMAAHLDKSLEVGKEALSMGKDAAAKASGFFSKGMMKEIFFFNTMLTPKIITVVYWIALFSYILVGLGLMFLGGSVKLFLIGLVTIIGGGVGTRIISELLIVLFKIHENIQRLADKQA